MFESPKKYIFEIGLNLLLKYLYVFLFENCTIGYFRLPILSNIEFTI